MRIINADIRLVEGRSHKRLGVIKRMKDRLVAQSARAESTLCHHWKYNSA